MTKDDDLDKKQTEEVEVKKPTEVNVNVTFKNDQAVKNATVEEANSVKSSVTVTQGSPGMHIVFTDADGNEHTINEKSTLETEQVRNNVKGLSLDDLHTVYAQNGNSASAAYSYLTNFLQENKNDPEAIQNTVSMLLGDLSMAYDDTQTHRKVGIDQVDVLDKILSTDKGEQVPALICGTIHDFAAQALEDCGIKACLITGGQTGSEGTPHATLLYDRGDGKYVWNNYSKSMVIDAPSIKDAAKEVYKQSNSLESSGMIAFQDKDNNSYQEYAFKEEAAFGNEIDKRTHDSLSPFDNNVATRPSIDADVQVSSVGNVSANVGGTLAYGNNRVAKETSLDVEYKNNNETSMFMKSQSVGAKVEHKVDNQETGLYYNIKAVTSYTKGETGITDYNVIENAPQENDNIETTSSITQGPQDNQYLTTMLHGEIGKKTTLVSNENLELTNVGQASLHAFGTLGLGNIKKAASADSRLTLEEGLGMQNNLGDVNLNSSLSGGVVIDATQTCDGAKPAFGPKFNAATSVKYNPSENLQLNANAKAYSVFTKSSTDYGVQAGFGAKYKPAGTDITIFGSANAAIEQQDLSIGLFNQKTENNISLSTTVGAQLNKNTMVWAGYTHYKDNLNYTRNYNQVEIGARFTF